MAREQRWGFAAAMAVFIAIAIVVDRTLSGNSALVGFIVAGVAGAAGGRLVTYLAGPTRG
jgi:hypothetical protein